MSNVSPAIGPLTLHPFDTVTLPRCLLCVKGGFFLGILHFSPKRSGARRVYWKALLPVAGAGITSNG